jgi:hypothetical protein
MISEETWQKTSGKFTGRAIGLIRVVGRAKPVHVFEITGTQADSETCDKRFDQAIACCMGKKWREALDLFESRPDDPVARLYANHCRHIIENPVMDWDGVWILDRK